MGDWLTYRQAADRLGISPEAVRALARRRGWSRQSPNEVGGIARVLLPTDIDRRSRPGESDGVTGVDRGLPDGRPSVAIRPDRSGDRPGYHPGDRAGELAAEVAVLRERIADKDAVIADLRERLDAAERGPAADPMPATGMQSLSQAVEMLRQDVERERERADRAERQGEIEWQLVEDGRKRIDELQRRIDGLYTELADARTAAMISGCEAAALRSRLALLTERRPWWRRWFR